MQLIQISEATAAQRRIFFTMVDSTDLHTRETGVTVSVRITKNGGATAAGGGSAPTQVDSTNFPGLYYYEATQGECDTVGVLALYFTGTGCEPREVAVQIVPWDPYDAVRIGLTALPNANAEATGGLFTRGTGAGQINQTNNGRVDSDVQSIANNAITAAAIATDAIDADSVKTDAITEITDAILAKAFSGTRTIKGLFKRLEAFVSGKATGLNGATAEFYDQDATTVVISADQDTGAGTRDAATVAGD